MYLNLEATIAKQIQRILEVIFKLIFIKETNTKSQPC